MNIRNHYTWPSVIPGNSAVLIVTERRLFFTNDAKSGQLESLMQSSDDRSIMSAFPKGLKSVIVAKIERIRMLEGDTHFRVFTDREKIVVPFGDKGADAAAEHFTALVESLEGFEVRGDSKAGPWENLQFPIACLLVTVGIGGLLSYFVSQDDFDYTGRRSGLAKLCFNIAHSLGQGGVSALIIIGVIGAAFWMYRRIKNPLRVFIASKA